MSKNKWNTYINTFPFRLLLLLFIGWGYSVLSSCKKYLEVSPDKSLVIPTRAADLQAILDYYGNMNTKYPGLLSVIADEYYLPTATYNSSNINDRDNYIWDPNNHANYLNSWTFPYQIVYNANVVLQELSNLPGDQTDHEELERIKGEALFYRSFAFYHLAQLYCKPYSATAASDPGIPLRTLPDLEVKSVRASVQQTYDLVIADLKEAILLLPETVPVSSRPGKAAAYGALARTYLSMRDYQNAGKFADSCLLKYNTLIDYNILSPDAITPIERFNGETIFHGVLAILTAPRSSALIDTVLYNTYDSNDLRKTILFKSTTGGYYFKGSYDGTGNNFNSFCGIATDEMYLIRAESEARAGSTAAAMEDLNHLLVNRWKSGTYIPLTVSDPGEALAIILSERRKELVYRGLRWTDLRRLNQEGANISLQRVIDGTTYTLAPDDLHWVMLIPSQVITVTGLNQNPR